MRGKDEESSLRKYALVGVTLSAGQTSRVFRYEALYDVDASKIRAA